MVNIENIELFESTLTSRVDIELLSDDNGGVWIGSRFRGLGHYEANGQWTIFNQTNSILQNILITSLLSDGKGGVWIGSRENNLIHYSADGQWTVVNPENLTLPENISVTTLLNDNHGGVWVGTATGLVHYSTSGQWTVLSKGNLDLPSNYIGTLLTDDNHNLWVGTGAGFGIGEGLARYDANNKWTLFNTANSGLPNISIRGLLSDKHNGLWVATFLGGLAHYSTENIWKIFNSGNSKLPPRVPILTLSEDGHGGIWLATYDKRLIHYDANEQWEVFNIEGLSPDSTLFESIYLLNGHDGVWIATSSIGLVHYNSINKQWTTFNQENSELLDNSVRALLNDENGGLWIGTDDGLNYRSANDQWKSFTKENSGLPYAGVSVILNDEQGGLWIGMSLAGLVHYRISNDQWTVFNRENSKLPSNYIKSLSNDGSGGMWVGTDGGLAHLTFGHKTELCAKIDDASCQALLTGQRAAIIVAGGGAQRENTLWDTTEEVSNKLYDMLNRRGFDRREIYYLSPKVETDVNGDGTDEPVTQSPKRGLQIEDVQAAFDWAKNRGQLNQPLYLFFIDHGGEGKLMLSKSVELKVTDLKAMLDDYQAKTGNQVILVVEACHSGSFLAPLVASNRALITSAKAEELAYFLEKQGFTSFLADNLLKSMNFVEAFDRATQKQQRLQKELPQLTATLDNGKRTSQTPQLDDNYDGLYTQDDGQWLQKVYINGNFVTADMTLAVQSLTSSTVLKAGEPFTLKAKATTAAGSVQRVWAILKPPKMDFLLDIYGTPITAYPRIDLAPSQEENLWQTIWQEALYNGKYQLIFYAKDNEGNIASSEEELTLTVIGGIDPPEQATVTVQLNQTRYQKGEHLTATLTEDLNWGYDLYAAVVLPDGHFVTLKKANEFKALDNPIPWIGTRTPARPLTLIDMTLPETLPSGNYCLYGILSPKDQPPLESQFYWKVGQQCFEID